MGYTFRATASTRVDITKLSDVDGDAATAAAESIRAVGLLMPLVLSTEGRVVDGLARAHALRLLGEADAPAISVSDDPSDLTQALALRRYLKAEGVKLPPSLQSVRATLDRVEKILAIASDPTLPHDARTAAAIGLTQVGAGEAVNTVLTRLSALLERTRLLERYPDLEPLPLDVGLRMAAYLDAITDPTQREAELAVLRMTTGESTRSRDLSMAVYAHMKDLSQLVDDDRAQEVAQALAAAVSGHSLTPALRERCLTVAAQLERTAAGIRTAMSLEVEFA